MKIRFHLVTMIAGMLVAGCTIPSHNNEPRYEARQVPERADDFAFENDKVAFRVYGPALRESAENNGTDCWLKRVSYPIINKWYQQHSAGQSYHIDHGEGYDPYHVGNSLGCGGLALWQPEKADPLAQPNVYQNFSVIETSSNKVEFALTYQWPDTGIQEIKHITLIKGSQLFEVNSRFTQHGKPIQLTVAVGITTHDGKTQLATDANQQFVAGAESIDDSFVGTAVLLPEKFPATFRHLQSAQKDRSHGLLITQTTAAGEITYYAGYGWSKAGEIITFADWQSYLANYLSN